MNREEMEAEAARWLQRTVAETLDSVTDEDCLDIPSSKDINSELIRTRLYGALFAALHKGFELSQMIR